MAQYRNETLGVINVDGNVMAPKATAEIEDGAVGLERMIKRGVLSKIDARTKSAKQESKSDKSE